MEKIWIKNKKPKKIIELDEIHYFYWPIEIGIMKHKIFGIEFHLPFPIKFHDFEPIKLLNFKDKKIIASRFHYEILTFFNNLLLYENKAIVDFSFGSHSPYVFSDKDSQLGTRIALDRFSATQLRFILLLITFYHEIVFGKKEANIEELNDYEIEEGKIPKEAIFDINKCHSIIWIGHYPEEDTTPPEIWSVIKS